MPHCLYLGSGIVQPRLRFFDAKHDLLPQHLQSPSYDRRSIDKDYYIPSLRAIRHSYMTSAIELAVALFTFTLFIDSSIVIVSGVSLHDSPDAPEADIFSVHKLLSESMSSGRYPLRPCAAIIQCLSRHRLYHHRADGLRGSTELDVATLAASPGYPNYQHHTQHRHRRGRRSIWLEQLPQRIASRLERCAVNCVGATHLLHMPEQIHVGQARWCRLWHE